MLLKTVIWGGLWGLSSRGLVLGLAVAARSQIIWRTLRRLGLCRAVGVNRLSRMGRHRPRLALSLLLGARRPLRRRGRGREGGMVSWARKRGNVRVVDLALLIRSSRTTTRTRKKRLRVRLLPQGRSRDRNPDHGLDGHQGPRRDLEPAHQVGRTPPGRSPDASVRHPHSAHSGIGITLSKTRRGFAPMLRRNVSARTEQERSDAVLERTSTEQQKMLAALEKESAPHAPPQCPLQLRP
jgi:hypothetical protein